MERFVAKIYKGTWLLGPGLCSPVLLCPGDWIFSSVLMKADAWWGGACGHLVSRAQICASDFPWCDRSGLCHSWRWLGRLGVCAGGGLQTLKWSAGPSSLLPVFLGRASPDPGAAQTPVVRPAPSRALWELAPTLWWVGDELLEWGWQRNPQGWCSCPWTWIRARDQDTCNWREGNRNRI